MNDDRNQTVQRFNPDMLFPYWLVAAVNFAFVVGGSDFRVCEYMLAILRFARRIQVSPGEKGSCRRGVGSASSGPRGAAPTELYAEKGTIG